MKDSDKEHAAARAQAIKIALKQGWIEQRGDGYSITKAGEHEFVDMTVNNDYAHQEIEDCNEDEACAKAVALDYLLFCIDPDEYDDDGNSVYD